MFDEHELREFLEKAKKIAPEAVKTREELPTFDFGSPPDIILGLRSHRARALDFGDAIYYGEVRID